MKLIRWMIYGVGVATMALLPCVSRAEGTNPAPDFKEVYDLVRTHLAGETDADLNLAAIQGLLNQLHAKVSLVSPKSETNKPDEGPLLTRSLVYGGSVAYFRIARVGQDLDKRIASAYNELSASNHLKGIVLDLRFADGHNYSEAALVAGLFIPNNVPLLDWGNGMVHSQEKSDAITLPLVVLVNERTAAAPEALAAVLRKSAHAIILGVTTSGEATIGREFPLKNGQSLRIATAGIKLGDDESLSASGIKPDIEVPVLPEDEKAWFENPYKDLAVVAPMIGLDGMPLTNTTNRATHTRTTEADLMRERNERPGVDLEYITPASLPGTEPEKEKPVIHDPVLGRALDLVKAISVIRQTRSP